MADWESTFIHNDLQMILSVYLGDLKMAGPVDNVNKARSLIRDVISIDDPTSLGKYLGCGHEKFDSVSQGVVKSSFGHIPLLPSQYRTSNGSAAGGFQRNPVQEATAFSKGAPIRGGGGGDSGDTIRNERLHGTVR